MRKRILSMILAVLMVVSLLPVGAFAEEEPEEETEYVGETTDAACAEEPADSEETVNSEETANNEENGEPEVPIFPVIVCFVSEIPGVEMQTTLEAADLQAHPLRLPSN